MKTKPQNRKQAETASEHSSSHETPVSFYILMGLLAAAFVVFLGGMLFGL